MRFLGGIPLLFLLGTLFVSCNSTKKLTLFQDNIADSIQAPGLIKTMQLQQAQYHLKTGDRLRLNIFSLTEDKYNFLDTPFLEVRIDNNGQVQIPVVGNVALEGLTIAESEKKLDKALADYLKSPAVSIRLLNFNITVLGEVTKQGTFIADDTKVTILEAIGQAGGLTENANREDIRIIRNINDTARIFHFNLLEDNSLQSENYYLQQNDVVIINPLKSKTSKESRTATISIIVSVLSIVTIALIQIFDK